MSKHMFDIRQEPSTSFCAHCDHRRGIRKGASLTRRPRWDCCWAAKTQARPLARMIKTFFIPWSLIWNRSQSLNLSLACRYKQLPWCKWVLLLSGGWRDDRLDSRTDSSFEWGHSRLDSIWSTILCTNQIPNSEILVWHSILCDFIINAQVTAINSVSLTVSNL